MKPKKKVYVCVFDAEVFESSAKLTEEFCQTAITLSSMTLTNCAVHLSLDMDDYIVIKDRYGREGDVVEGLNVQFLLSSPCDP